MGLISTAKLNNLVIGNTCEVKIYALISLQLDSSNTLSIEVAFKPEKVTGIKIDESKRTRPFVGNYLVCRNNGRMRIIKYEIYNNDDLTLILSGKSIAVLK